MFYYQAVTDYMIKVDRASSDFYMSSHTKTDQFAKGKDIGFCPRDRHPLDFIEGLPISPKTYGAQWSAPDIMI